MQLLVLYYYNSDEDEEDAVADDFLELLRLFQSHNFGRKVRKKILKVIVPFTNEFTLESMNIE